MKVVLVNYGLIPRSYGLAYTNGNVKILCAPTRFLEAAFMAQEPFQRREIYEQHAVFTWADFESAVKETNNSYNLTRKIFFEDNSRY